MEIKQLRYFITIAEEGNITKAAEKLYMAQPPLSRQLKNIEEELGVKLFDRSYKKNMILTQEGRIFLDKARKIVYDVSDAIHEVQEYHNSMVKNIAIGTTVYCSEIMLPALRTFQNHYPFVTPEIYEDNISNLLRMLDKRIIDVALTDRPLNIEGYDVFPLESEECVLVASRDFEWTEDVITLRELSHIPLVLLNGPDNNSLYSQINKTFEKNHLKPSISCLSYDSGMLIRMILTKIGASILPLSMVNETICDFVRIIKIKDNPWTINPVLMWRKEGYLSSTAEAFIKNFL